MINENQINALMFMYKTYEWINPATFNMPWQPFAALRRKGFASEMGDELGSHKYYNISQIGIEYIEMHNIEYCRMIGTIFQDATKMAVVAQKENTRDYWCEAVDSDIGQWLYCEWFINKNKVLTPNPNP
jgi:hypothetical protein